MGSIFVYASLSISNVCGIFFQNLISLCKHSYICFFLPFSLLLPLSYTQKIAPSIHFVVTSFFTEILECKNGERILILFLFLVFFFTAAVFTVMSFSQLDEHWAVFNTFAVIAKSQWTTLCLVISHVSRVVQYLFTEVGLLDKGYAGFQWIVKCLSTLGEVIILHSPCKIESVSHSFTKSFSWLWFDFAKSDKQKWHFSAISFISAGITIFSHFRRLHFPLLMYLGLFLLNIYLFNSGRAGSSSLHGLFSRGEQGPPSSCSAQASPCGASLVAEPQLRTCRLH